MYLSNVPLILSSLTFAMPYYAAFDTGNILTAACWCLLTTTSTLVHATKRPFHIYGHGNCIPTLYTADVVALNICALRAIMDGWAGGPIGLLMTAIVLSYAAIVFYGGRYFGAFVYDRSQPVHAMLGHVSVHLLSAIGCTGVIYLRAFKNGLTIS